MFPQRKHNGESRKLQDLTPRSTRIQSFGEYTPESINLAASVMILKSPWRRNGASAYAVVWRVHVSDDDFGEDTYVDCYGDERQGAMEEERGQNEVHDSSGQLLGGLITR